MRSGEERRDVREGSKSWRRSRWKRAPSDATSRPPCSSRAPTRRRLEAPRAHRLAAARREAHVRHGAPPPNGAALAPRRGRRPGQPRVRRDGWHRGGRRLRPGLRGSNVRAARTGAPIGNRSFGTGPGGSRLGHRRGMTPPRRQRCHRCGTSPAPRRPPYPSCSRAAAAISAPRRPPTSPTASSVSFARPVDPCGHTERSSRSRIRGPGDRAASTRSHEATRTSRAGGVMAGNGRLRDGSGRQEGAPRMGEQGRVMELGRNGPSARPKGRPSRPRRRAAPRPRSRIGCIAGRPGGFPTLALAWRRGIRGGRPPAGRSRRPPGRRPAARRGAAGGSRSAPSARLAGAGIALTPFPGRIRDPRETLVGSQEFQGFRGRSPRRSRRHAWSPARPSRVRPSGGSRPPIA